MIAYKGFHRGLSCRGYRFVRGWNETEKANCAQNGFHAATNPLDCLNYYPDANKSEYWIVECAGDMDEDAIDSKVTCTRMHPIAEIGIDGLIACGLRYALKHRRNKISGTALCAKADAGSYGWAVASGKNPCCTGRKIGDVLGFLQTVNNEPRDALFVIVDGKEILPDVAYTFDQLTGRDDHAEDAG